MTRSIEILFTHDDERDFSMKIRSEFPDVIFVDDMYWQSRTPPVKDSILDCASKFVFIWNRQLFPSLPSLPRPDGTFHGPQSGMVIQLIRSVQQENELRSGTLLVGFDPSDEGMKAFVDGVWKIARKMTKKKIVQVNPTTGEVLVVRTDIRIGDNAFIWCKDDENRFLRFYNSPLIYLRPE